MNEKQKAIVDKYIPTEFTINNMEYKMIYEDHLIHHPDDPDGDERDLGQAHYYVEPFIKLATHFDELGDIHPMKLLNTYYHELFHVLSESAHLQLSEEVIQSLANVYQQYILSQKR